MNTTQWLLLAVICLPVIEIYFLIQMISGLGLLLTLSLLIGAAALGGYLLRNQGWQTWMKVNDALQRGELPAEALLNGSLIALGGGLLLFPGFMSDLMALICLLPFTRKWLMGYLIRSGSFKPFTPGQPGYLEGEFKRDE
jgi:UPF0716 protein FxsA